MIQVGDRVRLHTPHWMLAHGATCLSPKLTCLWVYKDGLVFYADELLGKDLIVVDEGLNPEHILVSPVDDEKRSQYVPIALLYKRRKNNEQ